MDLLTSVTTTGNSLGESVDYRWDYPHAFADDGLKVWHLLGLVMRDRLRDSASLDSLGNLFFKLVVHGRR